MQTLFSRIKSLPKKRLFAVIIRILPFVVFVALAISIAANPSWLPYDEQFHFGLIQLYAHHLNPFLSSQPAGANAFGAVARDPSYLYHYVMSFPYRLITLFTRSQLVQIYALRAVNIGLGATTLYLAYRLCRRFGMSNLASNIIILCLALTPTFYDLSAQINYDNLLMPLILLSVLVTIRVTTEIRLHRPNPLHLAGLVALLLVSSLVMYSFLPIMLAVLIYLVVVCIRAKSFKTTVDSLGRSFSKMQLQSKLLLILLLVVSSGLWIQRYGVNIVEYHTLIPGCNQVLSVQQCSNYTPWYRNYELLAKNSIDPTTQSISLVAPYTTSWMRAMYTELFAIIYTNSTGAHYAFNLSVRVIASVLIPIGVLGLLIGGTNSQRRKYPWGLLVTIAIFYTVTLFASNYNDYYHLGVTIAVQGRYLIMVLPLLYLIVGYGYTHLTRAVITSRSKAPQEVRQVEDI